MSYSVSYDEYPRCNKCGKRWQLLDWSCALHRLTCGNVDIPQSEKDDITMNASNNGMAIKWS